MTIEPAYAALAAAVGAALAHESVGFLASADRLEIDPESAIEVGGDIDAFETAASIEKARTGPVRQKLGLPQQRFLVERLCRVELQASGPDRTARLAALDKATAALALLPNSDPTLGGSCERLVLNGAEDSVFEPNGAGKILEFTIRIRSSDALGMSD